jgi:hypothetical protein
MELDMVVWRKQLNSMIASVRIAYGDNGSLGSTLKPSMDVTRDQSSFNWNPKQL